MSGITELVLTISIEFGTFMLIAIAWELSRIARALEKQGEQE